MIRAPSSSRSCRTYREESFHANTLMENSKQTFDVYDIDTMYARIHVSEAYTHTPFKILDELRNFPPFNTPKVTMLTLSGDHKKNNKPVWNRHYIVVTSY